MKVLTVFPDVQFTVTSSPLTPVTSPSIQATSGSSIQTWDPTTIPDEAVYNTSEIVNQKQVWVNKEN